MPSERSLSLICLAFLSLLTACEPKDAGPADLIVSPTSIDFGEVGLGDASSEALTLTNAGGGQIELLSVSLIDGDDDVFSVDYDIDFIEAGQSASVTVRCEPDEEGLEEGQLQVRSSDEDEPQLYVDLSCTGAPSTADDDGDGYSPATGDCDDDDASAFPGNDEVCDGVDNDCSGAPDADEADADYDGWRVCEEDCDDGDANVYPGAREVCDDKDSDCDGSETDREDQDGDGYAVCDGDCDDAEPLSWPGNEEVCDGVDNDCSEEADDLDEDGDGHSPCGEAGDCDDGDPDAYPVVLDAAAADGGDGTEALPYNSLDDALAGLDAVCRTVILAPGTYAISFAWEGDPLTLAGGGEDPSEVVLGPAEAGSRVAEVTGGGALTLQNLTLSGAAADGDGGALWASLADLSLTDVVADGNSSTGDGGAVAVNAGTLTVSGCTFTANTAADDGGAIAVVSGALVDEGSWYEGNSGVRGGAILLEGAEASIDSSEFWSNAASQEGGGVALAGAGPLEIRRAVLALNTAGTLGGALSFTDVDDPSGEITNLFVQDNEAAVAGGGVAVTGDKASFVLANNTLTGNTASGEGGGLYVDADDASELIAWSNLVIASYGESGLYVVEGAGADVAYCTAYLSSSGVEFGGEATAGSDENTEENPLFSSFTNDGDPTDDDLSLERSSPARNSGPEGARWEDTDGSQNDRGATGGPEASP